ncbi:MAG: hypothetical protein AB7F89_26070, partial [Pirellulaceae bacterium]
MMIHGSALRRTVKPVVALDRFWPSRFGVASLLMIPGALIVATALLLPLAYIVSFSLNPSRIGVTELTSDFTLAQYATLFSDYFYLGILGRTILIAAMTTAICAVCGYV